jgi:hypothetical protein
MIAWEKQEPHKTIKMVGLWALAFKPELSWVGNDDHRIGFSYKYCSQVLSLPIVAVLQEGGEDQIQSDY